MLMAGSGCIGATLLGSFKMTTAQRGPQGMPARNTDQPIRILHLSDIHFRASKTWDSDPVLRALTDFVGKNVEAEGPPDLIAITGDLAFSGRPDEYKLARTWLDQLWPKLGRPPKDHLLLVPGNHDVDRIKVNLTAEAVQTLLLNGRDQQRIATVLGLSLIHI